jgi:hypothetical protein
MTNSAPRPRRLAAAIATGLAFPLAVTLLFSPAQAILADPRYQSAKMLEVFFRLEPLPRVGTQPLAVLLGFVGFGAIIGLVYCALAPAFHGRAVRKGLRFGFVLWLMAFVWFEFFMLWNVLHEPLPLILLELALWLGVSLLVGLAAAWAARA